MSHSSTNPLLQSPLQSIYQHSEATSFNILHATTHSSNSGLIESSFNFDSHFLSNQGMSIQQISLSELQTPHGASLLNEEKLNRQPLIDLCLFNFETLDELKTKSHILLQFARKIPTLICVETSAAQLNDIQIFSQYIGELTQTTFHLNYHRNPKNGSKIKIIPINQSNDEPFNQLALIQSIFNATQPCQRGRLFSTLKPLSDKSLVRHDHRSNYLCSLYRLCHEYYWQSSKDQEMSLLEEINLTHLISQEINNKLNI